jgi:hypothetical protein
MVELYFLSLALFMNFVMLALARLKFFKPVDVGLKTSIQILNIVCEEVT